LLSKNVVFSFKAENKAMRSASTYPPSLSAPNKLFACLVVCMTKSLYNYDIQAINPPNKYRVEESYRHHPAACCLHARSGSHPFISQTVCAVLHNKIYLLAGEE